MSTKVKSEAYLRHMDTKVRDMCEDLDPDYITENTAAYMNNELGDMCDAWDRYRNDMEAFLYVYAKELTEEEVRLWQCDMKSVQDTVEATRHSVETKINLVMPPSVPRPMTEFEREMLKLMEKSKKLDQEAALFYPDGYKPISFPTRLVSKFNEKAASFPTSDKQAICAPAPHEQAESVPVVNMPVATAPVHAQTDLTLQDTAEPGHVQGEQQFLGVQAVTHQAVPQQPGHVLGELQHLEVQAVTNQAVLQSPKPPGQPVVRALGEPQLLGVQAVTNQAVLQSPKPPGQPVVRALGEPQLLGLQAVTNQAVLQLPQPPGNPQYALGEQQLLGVQAVTHQAIAQQPGRVLGEPQHLGVQAFTHQALTQPPDNQPGCVEGEPYLLQVQAVTHQNAPQSPSHPHLHGCVLGEQQHQVVQAVTHQLEQVTIISSPDRRQALLPLQATKRKKTCNSSKKERLDNDLVKKERFDMDIGKMKRDKFSVTGERKELVITAHAKCLWKKFLAKQLLVYNFTSLGGPSVDSRVASKCLNDTIRAHSLKLALASLVTFKTASAFVTASVSVFPAWPPGVYELLAVLSACMLYVSGNTSSLL